MKQNIEIIRKDRRGWREGASKKVIFKGYKRSINTSKTQKM